MTVVYLRRQDHIEGGQHRYSCDYVFQVQGSEPRTACVGINGSWHENIPAFSWRGSESELVAIATKFLEGELARGWVPTDPSNRLQISDAQMEQWLQVKS